MYNDTPPQKTDRLLGVTKRYIDKWLYNKKMKNIIKHLVQSCAINKISQLGLFKIYSKIQFVLKTTQLVWGGI